MSRKGRKGFDTMEYVVMNNELALPLERGFHVMDEEEKSQLDFLGGAAGTCLSDPERHMMISIGWSKIGRLPAMLLNTGEIAKNMEGRVREPMAEFGYRLEGFINARVGGKNAEGFDYGYEAEDTRMFAESLIIKHRKSLYNLHMYCRWENRGECHRTWRDMLEAGSWK